MDVDFLLLRSFGTDNALARVQSDPLFSGLSQLAPRVHKLLYSPGDNLTVPRPRFVVVHYNDNESMQRAKVIKSLTKCKVICMGSDIYRLGRYVEIAEIADIFTVPTELHREVLRSAVWVDVFVVPEGIDPIALPANGAAARLTGGNQVCWFGYRESFDKSFKFILEEAVRRSQLPPGNLTLITSPGPDLFEGARHVKFDQQTFYEQTAEFGYSILSHFAFDCHVNSFIKTPNKLITCLVRGLIPLVSNTRNYRRLVDEYDLHPFLYSDGFELVKLLKNLDFAADKSKVNEEGIVSDLKAKLAPRAIAETFLSHL